MKALFSTRAAWLWRTLSSPASQHAAVRRLFSCWARPIAMRVSSKIPTVSI